MNASSYLISCSDNSELNMNHLCPSRSSLREGQVKVVWEFLHPKVKTLIVRAGWQTRDKQVGGFTQLQWSCEVVSFFTETWGQGTQRWGVPVRTVILCCTDWFVLTQRRSNTEPWLLHVTDHHVWFISFGDDWNSEVILCNTYRPARQTGR